jgi:2-methylcitrate dehydratase PrpD
MQETRELIKRCFDLRYGVLSEEVIDRTKYLLLDYIGVAARGSLSDSSVPVHRFIKKMGSGRDGAVVVGTDIKTEAPYAAISNGTSSHSLELDDVVNAASLHPAVAIMSAAFAAAHMAGCAGKDLLEGIVIGYEVMIRLGIALDPSAHYAQGFHPTGTCGAMGSAAAAAKILKLEQSAMGNALGIAGSQAAGSMEFLADGAFTKRLHPGWAAHSGLVAALLAREGFTGPGTILEGERGFLHSYSSKGDPARLLENWGNPYMVMKTSIKPHSCCRYKQGPIDGILEIMRREGLQASEVDRITLGILKTGFPLIVHPRDLKYNPKSVVDAQFSMPFGGAVAVLFGKASLDEYQEENLRSQNVKEMMDRVECVEDPTLEEEFPVKWPASVTITSKDGKKYTTRVEYPKGDPENALTWQELIDKFDNLTSVVYKPEKKSKIIEYVKNLDKQNSLIVFFDHLAK